jgi:hypothetical protein
MIAKQNAGLAIVFFCCALVFGADIGFSSPDIVSQKIQSMTVSTGRHRHEMNQCTLYFISGFLAKTAVLDPAICHDLHPGDIVSTEKSTIFGRTSLLTSNGKTYQSIMVASGTCVIFAFLASCLLLVGALTLPLENLQEISARTSPNRQRRNP